MKHKRIVVLGSVAAIVLLLSLAAAMAALAGSGAAFTTFNAHVDGAGKDVCKNSAINCNTYGAKEYVWLNGGPTANGLTNQGSAYVFTRRGAIWSQQRKITASDGAAQDFFGISISLASDTAIVGASGVDILRYDDQGAAYIFDFTTLSPVYLPIVRKFAP